MTTEFRVSESQTMAWPLRPAAGTHSWKCGTRILRENWGCFPIMILFHIPAQQLQNNLNCYKAWVFRVIKTQYLKLKIIMEVNNFFQYYKRLWIVLKCITFIYIVIFIVLKGSFFLRSLVRRMWFFSCNIK